MYFRDVQMDETHCTQHVNEETTVKTELPVTSSAWVGGLSINAFICIGLIAITLRVIMGIGL